MRSGEDEADMLEKLLEPKSCSRVIHNGRCLFPSIHQIYDLTRVLSGYLSKNITLGGYSNQHNLNKGLARNISQMSGLLWERGETKLLDAALLGTKRAHVFRTRPPAVPCMLDTCI